MRYKVKNITEKSLKSLSTIHFGLRHNSYKLLYLDLITLKFELLMCVNKIVLNTYVILMFF